MDGVFFFSHLHLHETFEHDFKQDLFTLKVRVTKRGRSSISWFTPQEATRAKVEPG